MAGVSCAPVVPITYRTQVGVHVVGLGISKRSLRSLIIRVRQHVDFYDYCRCGRDKRVGVGAF